MSEMNKKNSTSHIRNASFPNAMLRKGSTNYIDTHVVLRGGSANYIHIPKQFS